MRHHRVDQAHAQCLLRAVAAAQVPDFARFLFADHAREQRGAEARIDRTHFRSHLSELRLVRGDGQIADRHQHIAAADGVAVDAGDNRFGNIADDALHFLYRQPDRTAPAVAAVFCVRGLVAAGAERLVAGSGEHDDADVTVPARLAEGLDQFFAGSAVERVVDFRPVDGDGGDAVRFGVDDVLEFHGCLFLLSCSRSLSSSTPLAYYEYDTDVAQCDYDYDCDCATRT